MRAKTLERPSHRFNARSPTQLYRPVTSYSGIYLPADAGFSTVANHTILGAAETFESVTSSVSEGAKGLVKSMGMGGFFGMGDDKPEDSTHTSSDSSAGGLTRTVQQHLKTLGYDPGNTEGEESVQTSIAISQFQAEKGMEVTGEVTPQLAGLLEAEVEK